MAANTFFSKLVLLTTACVVLAQILRGNAVEELFSEGLSALEELSRSKRATKTDVAVVKAATEGLLSCKLTMRQGPKPLDPLNLDRFVFEIKRMGEFMKSNFSNMTLYGLSSLRVESIAADATKLNLRFTLNFTDWNLAGRYNLTSRTYGSKTIRGNDTFVILAEKVKFDANATLRVNSAGFFSVADLELPMDFGKAKVRFNKMDKAGNSDENVKKVIVTLARQVVENTIPKVIQNMMDALQTCLNSKLKKVNVYDI